MSIIEDEFMLVFALSLLLTFLILSIAIIWMRNRTLLSSVHINPEFFKLSTGVSTSFVNIRQGVEVSVAKIQAEADRNADRLPEEGEGTAQPDRFVFNSNINKASPIIDSTNRIVGLSTHLDENENGVNDTNDNTISDRHTHHHQAHDEETHPPFNNRASAVDDGELLIDEISQQHFQLSPIEVKQAAIATPLSSSITSLRKRG